MCKQANNYNLTECILAIGITKPCFKITRLSVMPQTVVSTHLQEMLFTALTV
ncbi:MAG: hypothetical protein KF900_10640 [Bacteroidetes bacterium]|nr:hypothetical protein [Bacteroidota bacterium]